MLIRVFKSLLVLAFTAKTFSHHATKDTDQAFVVQNENLGQQTWMTNPDNKNLNRIVHKGSKSSSSTTQSTMEPPLIPGPEDLANLLKDLQRRRSIQDALIEELLKDEANMIKVDPPDEEDGNGYPEVEDGNKTAPSFSTIVASYPAHDSFSGLSNDSGLPSTEETDNVDDNSTKVNHSLEEKCGDWTESVQNTANYCSFWMEGVLLTLTGTFGLIGNTLSIVILSKPDMRNSFNQLLIALSTMDSIFITLAILDYSIARAFHFSTDLFVYSFPFIIYPLNNISFCASIFTTVALAYERYNAVCKPLHYRDVTARYSVRRRTFSYIIPVLLLSVVLNIPKFLETRFEWTKVENKEASPELDNASLQHNLANSLPLADLSNLLNETSPIAYQTTPAPVQWKVDFRVSDLRSHPDYIRFYINWTRLVTTGLVPMGALVYFNFGIFRGIQMTHERTRRRNTQRASEMNLAAILLCIVFLFFICHLPRILLNVFEFFMLQDMLLCGPEFSPPAWFFCTTSFNHWLLIVNASCNFLIYCSVGTNFKTAINKFCQKSKLSVCLPRVHHQDASPHPCIASAEQGHAEGPITAVVTGCIAQPTLNVACNNNDVIQQPSNGNYEMQVIKDMGEEDLELVNLVPAVAALDQQGSASALEQQQAAIITGGQKECQSRTPPEVVVVAEVNKSCDPDNDRQMKVLLTDLRRCPSAGSFFLTKRSADTSSSAAGGTTSYNRAGGIYPISSCQQLDFCRE